MRSVPSTLVRVTPSGSSTNAAAQRATRCGDAAQRVGVVERALELGVDDRVDLPRLVAAGLADGLLAFGVGPAGAVGDHVAVVARRAGGRRSRAARRAARRWGRSGRRGGRGRGRGWCATASAWRWRCSWRRSRSSSAASRRSGVVEAGAGEVRRVAGGGVACVLELLVDGVEHEHRVDRPRCRRRSPRRARARRRSGRCGRGRAARRRRAASAPLASGAGGERVELAVELVELAAEQARGLLSGRPG